MIVEAIKRVAFDIFRSTDMIVLAFASTVAYSLAVPLAKETVPAVILQIEVLHQPARQKIEEEGGKKFIVNDKGRVGVKVTIQNNYAPELELKYFYNQGEIVDIEVLDSNNKSVGNNKYSFIYSISLPATPLIIRQGESVTFTDRIYCGRDGFSSPPSGEYTVRATFKYGELKVEAKSVGLVIK